MSFLLSWKSKLQRATATALLPSGCQEKCVIILLMALGSLWGDQHKSVCKSLNISQRKLWESQGNHSAALKP